MTPQPPYRDRDRPDRLEAPDQPGSSPRSGPAYGLPDALVARARRRRARIVAEIERNRRGEYTVPTWVLLVILLALVGGVVALAALA